MAEISLFKENAGVLTLKRVAMIGLSGGLYIGVSDYWVDQWWTDESDETTAQRYRAVSQMALGLAGAWFARKWNKDVAIGLAVGGIVGGARRLWVSEDMPSKMDDWFGDEASDSSTPPRDNNGAGRAGLPARSREGRVVFTEARQQARMRA